MSLPMSRRTLPPTRPGLSVAGVECHPQAAGGVHFAAKDLSNGLAAPLASIPGGNNCPRCSTFFAQRHCRTTLQDDDQWLPRLTKCLDEFALRGPKPDVGAVATFEALQLQHPYFKVSMSSVKISVDTPSPYLRTTFVVVWPWSLPNFALSSAGRASRLGPYILVSDV